MSRIVHPYGPIGRLIECIDEDPVATAHAVRALGVPGVREVVAGARTVVIECADTASASVLDRRVRDLQDPPTILPPGRADPARVEIPVRFDGVDLADVASAIGWTPEHLVGRLTAIEFTVAFCGFAPGFAYLRGLPDLLHVPRRRTPRAEVPAGSVAIAAEYAAVYPAASPGGWHLLGRTDLAVWSTDRVPPALLAPGTVVRFVSVSGDP